MKTTELSPPIITEIDNEEIEQVPESIVQ